SLVVERVKEAKEKNYGLDVLRGEFTDLVKAGVVDATKVVRLALQNAASVAGMLLTTEALVVEKKEKKKEKAPTTPGMDEEF
ncbi:MAG: TCP-1/cpn60 chaperonin family protein, partial [Armatimonadota bacterium]|nr:TCP-1/cpn60 chaperonin family protein [Armatimonadota bacterium]